MSAAAAGWYPQPDGSQQYWDGMRWTGHVHHAPPATSGPQDAQPGPGAPLGASAYVPPTPAAYSAPAPSPYTAPTPYAAPMPYGAPSAYGPGYVAPKSAGLALLASFFIPGLGSMINGEVGKGVLILVGYVICIPFALFYIGIPLMLALWIYGMVDAYTSAQNWNRRHGIIG